jgi:hypothetical protein
MPKKRYDSGGNLQEYSQPIAMAGNLVGNTVEQVAGPTSMGGGIAGGALKGAAAGAAFGPWGAAIGGVIGGVAGGINAHKAKEADTAQKLQRKVLAEQMFIKNAGNTYKTGGQMKGKLNVVKGGTLNSVSDEAVEVNASNPQQTDSVELDQAFVDHGEIIDKDNRVYSDSVFLDGKSIAKHAKRLEKMKNKNPRFKEANSLIDSKLDELYNYQESTKQNEVKESFKKGGTIHIKPENRGKFNATKKKTGKTTEELTHSKNPVTKKRAIFAQNAKKWHHADGGTLDDKLASLNAFTEGPVNDSLQAMYQKQPGFATTPEAILKQKLRDYSGANTNLSLTGQPVTSINPVSPSAASLSIDDPYNTDKLSGIRTKLSSGEVDGGGPLYNPNTPQTSDQGINWNKAGTQLATYGPNIVNSFLQSKLKGPAAPTLETGTKLDRVDPSAQLAGNARQARNATKTLRNSVGQSSDLISATGSLLSRRLAADNAVIGNNQAVNAEIQGREAMVNQGVKARNAERLSGFKQLQSDFANRKLQMTSDNLANVSQKSLAQGREQNEIDRDKLALQIMKEQYGDSGIMSRHFDDMLDNYLKSKGYTKPGNKYGGKLSKKK